MIYPEERKKIIEKAIKGAKEQIKNLIRGELFIPGYINEFKVWLHTKDYENAVNATIEEICSRTPETEMCKIGDPESISKQYMETYRKEMLKHLNNLEL